MVAHPTLRIVFCGNRKVAEEWTRNFFRAVWKAAPHDPEAPVVPPVQTSRHPRQRSISVPASDR